MNKNLKAVGYGELQRRYELNVLPHFCASFITGKGARKTIVESDLITEIYPVSYDPGELPGEHLEFALRYEGVNLEILRALFEKIDQSELTAYIRDKPAGRYARKIWFLYEFLLGKRLDILDLTQGNYVDLLDSENYYTVLPVRSQRQRINNNLAGNADYCPLVRRTETLRKYETLALDKRCGRLLSKYPEELLKRALAYLYTKETKSSFEIEHVEPGAQRTMRFVSLLRQAGQADYLNKAALIALQRAVVDERFAGDDYRNVQNYVGESAGLNREIVHFVSPKPEDLPMLMEGWLVCCRQMLKSEVHPVIAATVTAFGFVFMHPFEDGNGRIHRFLIHHVLSRTGFTPADLIFPVSASMLKQPQKYDEALEFFSRPLMERLEFRLNANGELTVSDATGNFYRYIDMTRIAERLFEFVRDTVEKELIEELEFLVRYDKTRQALQQVVDLPDRKLDLFIRLCAQNKGCLAKGKRQEFSKLTDTEIAAMERAVQAQNTNMSP